MAWCIIRWICQSKISAKFKGDAITCQNASDACTVLNLTEDLLSLIMRLNHEGCYAFRAVFPSKTHKDILNTTCEGLREGEGAGAENCQRDINEHIDFFTRVVKEGRGESYSGAKKGSWIRWEGRSLV